MSQAPKDTRTPAEKARDTAGIIGSFKHEGYVPNPEDEPFIKWRSGAKSRPSNSSQFFANAPLSESERRALLPITGGIVTELKNPLDERALDRLMLTTGAAVAA